MIRAWWLKWIDQNRRLFHLRSHERVALVQHARLPIFFSFARCTRGPGLGLDCVFFKYARRWFFFSPLSHRMVPFYKIKYSFFLPFTFRGTFLSKSGNFTTLSAFPTQRTATVATICKQRTHTDALFCI